MKANLYDDLKWLLSNANYQTGLFRKPSNVYTHLIKKISNYDASLKPELLKESRKRAFFAEDSFIITVRLPSNKKMGIKIHIDTWEVCQKNYDTPAIRKALNTSGLTTKVIDSFKIPQRRNQPDLRATFYRYEPGKLASRSDLDDRFIRAIDTFRTRNLHFWGRVSDFIITPNNKIKLLDWNKIVYHENPTQDTFEFSDALIEQVQSQQLLKAKI
ncbi:MAG: hypothetical protein VKJ06_02035 [Vampirovibrionales bacterium]|nr:hypothetical protein [Vampirovibrionales bacterium]